MVLTNVNSSNIDAIGYENELLVIRFLTGSVYIYSGVPKEVFDALSAAESKGKFLNLEIKGKYSYYKLTK